MTRVVALLGLLCFASPAFGQPDAGPDAGSAPVAETLHIKSGATCTTAKGSNVSLPPGYFIPANLFDSLDLEVKRLQTAETRLTAENVSLRASADQGFGWGTVAMIAGAVVTGILGARYAL